MRSAVTRGLDRMLQRLTDLDFIAVPAKPFLRDWSEDFRKEAAAKAPRWSGDLAANIISERDGGAFPLWARVFAKDPKARWMEFGTGLLSDDPESPHQRYFPSPDGLRAWAGSPSNAWSLAKFIEFRGGTAPRHFFRDAADSANASMNARLARFGMGIEVQAEKG